MSMTDDARLAKIEELLEKLVQATEESHAGVRMALAANDALAEEQQKQAERWQQLVNGVLALSGEIRDLRTAIAGQIRLEVSKALDAHRTISDLAQAAGTER
jgi:hypothetical protein